MLAVRHNLITCATKGCPLPGDTLVAYRMPNRTFSLVDGRDRTIEGASVLLEHCARHAEQIGEQRAEMAAARDAHPAGTGR